MTPAEYASTCDDDNDCMAFCARVEQRRRERCQDDDCANRARSDVHARCEAEWADRSARRHGHGHDAGGAGGDDAEQGLANLLDPELLEEVRACSYACIAKFAAAASQARANDPKRVVELLAAETIVARRTGTGTEAAVVERILREQIRDIARADEAHARCSQGQTQECLVLALALKDGRGVAPDPRTAGNLLRKLCRGGEKQACAAGGALAKAPELAALNGATLRIQVSQGNVVEIGYAHGDLDGAYQFIDSPSDGSAPCVSYSGRFKAGLRDGKWTDNTACAKGLEFGQSRTEATYRSGRLNGPTTAWAFGKRASESNFRDGLLDGTSRTWHSCGALLEESSWRLGAECGIRRTWGADRSCRRHLISTEHLPSCASAGSQTGKPGAATGDRLPACRDSGRLHAMLAALAPSLRECVAQHPDSGASVDLSTIVDTADGPVFTSVHAKDPALAGSEVEGCAQAIIVRGQFDHRVGAVPLFTLTHQDESPPCRLEFDVASADE